MYVLNECLLNEWLNVWIMFHVYTIIYLKQAPVVEYLGCFQVSSHKNNYLQTLVIFLV